MTKPLTENESDGIIGGDNSMTPNMADEHIRQQAIMETFEKWKLATFSYYRNRHDNGEITKLYKELDKLGANFELLIDYDLAIRDAVEQGKQLEEIKL